jgi:haloalkane dehalogenase
VLPNSILRPLSDAAMAEYRRPFSERDSRQTTLNWPRQLTIAGEPADIVGAQRAFCRTWPNQTEVTVSGRHFIQDDSPDEIGLAPTGWMATATST